MDLLSTLLDDRDPDDVAVIASDGQALRPIAVKELRERIEAIGAVIGDVTGLGVRIACRRPLRALVAALAVFRAGGVVIPVNLRVPDRSEDGAAIEIDDDDVRFLPRPERFGTDVGLVLRTSGSSGASREVLLGRAGLCANIEAILTYLPLTEHRRPAIVLPLWYSYALVGQALTGLVAGATLVLLGDEPYPLRQLEQMAACEVDGVSSVPSSLRALADAALTMPEQQRPRLRYVASAGEALPPDLALRLRDAFPDARRFNQYGLTEASPRVAAIDDADPAFLAGSVGRPLPGITVAVRHADGRPATVADPAEIFVTGPSVMLGYRGDPQATARALTERGLATGDLGYLDDAGRLYVVARRDDVVKVGGERLSLIGVARALEEHPATHEVAVLSFVDPARGTRLVGFARTDDPDGLRIWARDRLQPAARPARWLVLDALPRNAHGKLDRARLRQLALTPAAP